MLPSDTRESPSSEEFAKPGERPSRRREENHQRGGRVEPKNKRKKGSWVLETSRGKKGTADQKHVIKSGSV